jgi:hypothetical protein
MKKRLSSILFSLLPFVGSALEMQPWFGDVYEFHFLGSYSYSRFHKVQNGTPQLTSPFNVNLIYLGLDFSSSPDWSLDADIQFADTTQESFNFRTGAVQARYLWLDDIVGDPVSLTTGINIRLTPTMSLRDVSCPSYGNADFELNAALGREIDASDDWRFRLWAFAAVGHANRGSPWVRGVAAIETNYDDAHKFAVYAYGTNAYGWQTQVDIDHFHGYAKIREKSIDLCFRYGYRMGVWGTMRFEYQRRVLAKSYPENVNTFLVGYLLPFSF